MTSTMKVPLVLPGVGGDSILMVDFGLPSKRTSSYGANEPI